MNKRGLDAKVLVELLLVVAGVVVLFLVYMLLSSGIKSGTDSEICRQSVIFATATKYVGLGKPWNTLNCKTKSKVIEGDKTKFIEETQKDIKDCEYQYLNGKADFVNSWGDYFTDINTQCFVCYIDSPKEDLKFDNGGIAYTKSDPLFIGVMIIKGGLKDTSQLSWSHFIGSSNIQNFIHIVTLGGYKPAFYYQPFVFKSNELKDICGEDGINIFT